MKRTRFAALAVTALVGGLVVWLAPASLAQTQIRVIDREGPYEKFVDVGRPGLSAGDVIVESHPLLDAVDGTEVGRDFTHETILRVIDDGADLIVVLDSTFRFGDGDVMFYGTARFSDVFTESGVTVAVIGGTGAYQGMVGTATLSATETEGEFLITIDLLGA